MTDLYTLSGISKVFQSGRINFRALDNINLSIEEGDVVALTGPSGSGKSTLLNILGLIEEPSKGSISFGGTKLKVKDDASLTEIRRESVGFIFQNFNLMPVLTAVENVEYALLLEGKMSRKDARQRAMTCLKALEMDEYADHRPAELSGGQRQRVAIARAIVKNPKVVIADEPTANLDSKTAEQIMNLVRKLNKDWNTTVIIATHDQALAQSANKIIKIKDGQVESIT